MGCMQNHKLIPGLCVCKIINLSQGLNGWWHFVPPTHLIPTKPIEVQRSQKGTHIVFHRSLCLALHDRRWADLTGARGRGRAFGGSRTLNLRAAGARARRAFSLGLIALGAIQENRLGPGNRRLQNIVAQIRNRGHFALQNVVA